MKVQLDLSNYATKTDLKRVTRLDTSSFAKKTDLAKLKCSVDKLDTDILKNVPTNLSTLERKGYKLGVNKLLPVPVDLSILHDVKNVVKQDMYNAKTKKHWR